jgi:hypothetical protein
MAEPITVDFLKAHARIDSTLDDALLAVYIPAARQLAEAWCNRFFVSQTATKTFRVNQVCDIPAAQRLSVSGFYTDLADIPEGYDYFVEYLKGVTINRDYPLDWYNLPTYTVAYAVTVTPADVPEGVKVAIARVATDLYRNRDNSGDPTVGITAKTLLAPHRII